MAVTLPDPRTGMSNPFFDRPILNSPYKRPARHWELDESGQPTQKIAEQRRGADFITPIPISARSNEVRLIFRWTPAVAFVRRWAWT